MLESYQQHLPPKMAPKTYPSPLAGYEGAEPLSDDRNEDGKSYKNVQTGVLSEAYHKFTEPLDNGIRGGL